MIEPSRPTRAKNVPMIEAMIEIAADARAGRATSSLAGNAVAEQHDRDRRDGVGLEEVGRHAGAVADVVAHVVRDHGRVARIVLGDARLDLPDEVGADVGGLRVDAAAETREDRDQRAAEGEADEVVDRRVRRVAEPAGQDPVVARDAEQAEPDDEHARDRAGAERDVERGLEAVPRGLGRPHVRAHRDVHPDEAGGRGEERPDQEADRRAPAELVVEAEQEERRRSRRWRSSGTGGADRPRRPPGSRVAISCIRSLPAGSRSSQIVSPMPYRDGEQSAQEREQHGVISEEAHCRLYVDGAEDSRRAEFLTHISGARASSYEKEG